MDNNRPTLSLNKKNKSNERQSVKPTHEVILGSLKKNNKSVLIIVSNGDQYLGTISQFDKYTITINENGFSNKKNTIFKHAIVSFKVEE